jgi:hypothetical protein
LTLLDELRKAFGDNFDEMFEAIEPKALASGIE